MQKKTNVEKCIVNKKNTTNPSSEPRARRAPRPRRAPPEQPTTLITPNSSQNVKELRLLNFSRIKGFFPRSSGSEIIHTSFLTDGRAGARPSRAGARPARVAPGGAREPPRARREATRLALRARPAARVVASRAARARMEPPRAVAARARPAPAAHARGHHRGHQVLRRDHRGDGHGVAIVAAHHVPGRRRGRPGETPGGHRRSWWVAGPLRRRSDRRSW